MTSLQAVADGLLTAVVTGLADLAPPRQYVTTGAIADDCGQAVVSWLGLVPLGGSVQAAQTGHPVRLRPQAVWRIRVVRCVEARPSARAAPTVAALESDATTILTMAARLWAAVVSNRETLFPGCEAVTFGNLTPVGPEGNMVGVDWEVRATLDRVQP